MIDMNAAWRAQQQARWMRPDAHRWIRPDVARFLKPGTDPASIYPALARKYSPSQPRVPAGNGLESGRWVDGSGAVRTDTRLASTDKPKLGRQTMLLILADAAKRLINAHRSENGLRDLFGRNEGTVAVTNIDGKDIFGSNSTSPTYTSADRIAAETMRDTLIEKYPDVMKIDNSGYKPNDALFHAETTTLLRAARENGGTLAGRSVEIFVDRPMCSSCNKILPHIGRELGNPTVIFVSPAGSIKTMHNGFWID